jgi:mycothiol maleylpyruvate isomerase-like protein
MTMPDGDPHAAVVAQIAAERLFWRNLVADVGEDRMEEPGPMGDWTFRDLASHLLGWRQHFIARLESAAEGRPEPPTPWPSDIVGDEAINAWIRARDLGRPLRDVLDEIDGSYERLAVAMAALPADLLVRADAFSWMGGEPLADTDLFSHLHQEHEASIRAWLAERG